MQFTLNFKLVLKLTGNVSLFARNHKILPSNLLTIPQTTQERIQHFWSPKNRREDSEFLTPKQHWRFRISDPPNNTGGDSEFLTPKQHRRGFRISDPPINTGRIQNFWPPNNTGKDSEFLTTKTTKERNSECLTPKQHKRGFRISDRQTTQKRIQNFWPPNNTGEDSEFLIPKQHRRGFRISDPQNNTRGDNSQGAGISHGCYECGFRLVTQENKRNIEPKEIPSCLIPRLLVVFTRQLEILVTALEIVLYHENLGWH